MPGQLADVSPPGPDLAPSGRGLTKRQCSVIAALETAARPHHTEANEGICAVDERPGQVRRRLLVRA